MASILFPEVVRVFNQPSRYKATFNGTAGAATDATQVILGNVGQTFKKAHIKNFTLSRGVKPQYAEYSVTFNVTTALAGNTKLYLDFIVETTNRQMELARPEIEFGMPLSIPVTVPAAGITTAAASQPLAQLFADSINAFAQKRDRIMTATASSGVLTISFSQGDSYNPSREGYYIKSLRSSAAPRFRLLTETNAPSTSAVLASPTTVVKPSKGFGWGSSVEFREKLQGHNSKVPYLHDFDEIPVQNQTYTVVSFTSNIFRPDPKVQEYSDSKRWLFYFNEATMDAQIDAWADFLLTTPVTSLPALESYSVSFLESDSLFAVSGAATATTVIADANGVSGTDYITVEQGTPVNADAAALLTAFKDNA